LNDGVVEVVVQRGVRSLRGEVVSILCHHATGCVLLACMARSLELNCGQPNFGVPSRGSVTKKTRLPEKAPFHIGLFKFSDDCTLFDFSDPAEPIVSVIYAHYAYPSLIFKHARLGCILPSINGVFAP
jgi:hypothetical protein